MRRASFLHVVLMLVLGLGSAGSARSAEAVLAGQKPPAATQKPTTQKPKPTTRKPASKPPARRTRKPAVAPAAQRLSKVPEVVCPQVLGTGVGSRLRFCDVMTGLDPAGGIVVTLPPHTGPLTLSFDLHNRHMYSEQEVQAGRGFARYTATIGALTMDGTLLSRAVVQSEVRTSRDLFDRVGGGAGPGGVKAVAPTGMERIVFEIPEDVNELSILGEKLTVETLNGTDLFSSANRPVAVVSNFSVNYKPGKKPAAKPPARKK